MMQRDLFLADRATEINLPELNYGPIACAVGQVQCVLRLAEKVKITLQGEVAIGPRSKEPLFVLPSGETIIITSHKRTRPEEVDGVLLRKQDGVLTWQSHRLIDNMKTDAASRGWAAVIEDRAIGWRGRFFFKTEHTNEDGSVDPGNEGLRFPQIGALHAIGAHWSLSQQPATIVMPTGTGKTETMLSTLAAFD